MSNAIPNIFNYNNKQQIKIELTDDNKCIIEGIGNNKEESKDNNIVSNPNNSNLIENTSKILSKSNSIQNNFNENGSFLDDCDLLNLSKSESECSVNKQRYSSRDSKGNKDNFSGKDNNSKNKSGDNNSSNLLISFSNISDVRGTNVNNQNLTKFSSNKEESGLTPSICNYYDGSPSHKKNESKNSSNLDEINIKDKFGVNSILTTWLIRDGYGFNAPHHFYCFY